MDHEEVRRLIDLLKDTDITELTIESEGSKISIKREKHLYPQEAAPLPSPAPERQPSSEPAAGQENLKAVTSPIVGIFHRSPAPGAPPFVEIGSAVRKGQVLCIVEAMKLMNEIESDTDGVIARILVENGQPVEYGEALFLIEPA